jgi:hypothetical protein
VLVGSPVHGSMSRTCAATLNVAAGSSANAPALIETRRDTACAIRSAPSPSFPTIEPPVRAAICASRCPYCCERCILGIDMYLAISDRVLRGRCFMPPTTGSSWSRNGGLTPRRRTSPAPCAKSRVHYQDARQHHNDMPISATVHSRRRSRAPVATGDHPSAAPGSGCGHPDDGCDHTPPKTSGGAAASRPPRSPTRRSRADRPGTDAPACTA